MTTPPGSHPKDLDYYVLLFDHGPRGMTASGEIVAEDRADPLTWDEAEALLAKAKKIDPRAYMQNRELYNAAFDESDFPDDD